MTTRRPPCPKCDGYGVGELPGSDIAAPCTTCKGTGLLPAVLVTVASLSAALEEVLTHDAFANLSNDELAAALIAACLAIQEAD